MNSWLYVQFSWVCWCIATDCRYLTYVSQFYIFILLHFTSTLCIIFFYLDVCNFSIFVLYTIYIYMHTIYSIPRGKSILSLCALWYRRLQKNSSKTLAELHSVACAGRGGERACVCAWRFLFTLLTEEFRVAALPTLYKS